MAVSGAYNAIAFYRVHGSFVVVVVVAWSRARTHTHPHAATRRSVSQIAKNPADGSLPLLLLMHHRGLDDVLALLDLLLQERGLAL